MKTVKIKKIKIQIKIYILLCKDKKNVYIKRTKEIEGIKEKKNNKDIEECIFRPIMVNKY